MNHKALSSRRSLWLSSALIATLSVGQGSAQSDAFANTGFSISIDQTTIAGAPAMPTPTHRNDLLANLLNVDVRYDGLDSRRMLNVVTADGNTAYRAGDTIEFRTSTNYPAFVDRAELRIIDLGARGKPLLATLPISANGTTGWAMPDGGSGQFAYVLRVYDANGRYDETVPLDIRRAVSVFDAQATGIAPGEGEDNTARRGIPVRGGLITASGSGAYPNSTVTVMGETIPVDANGNFVVSRILPAGDQVVSVTTRSSTIVRDVRIPESEWFTVGIADITAGFTANTGGYDAGGYVDGRVAFYVKGKTARGWSITGSLDTGNGPIGGILSRLNDKDPQRILDRLRSNGTSMYPTFGDDSTYFDDTPTAGRIYLRAENENFRLTWGDFKAGMTGSALLQNTRALYGAELRYQSSAVTDTGEARVAAIAYAAQPDTLGQRDVMQGTGGSIYFLSRQDINGGSVSLSVQVIDKDTGRVISSIPLQEGRDYTIDHLQGMALLTAPLASTAAGAGVVASGGNSYTVNLVARYEYTPTSTAIDDLAIGGRVEAWVGNKLRFGATVMRETTTLGEQNMAGADLRYQLSEASYANLEFARSSGPGFGYANSTDGGLTIISSTGVASTGANAILFDARMDFRDLGFGAEGFLGLYYERKDTGFSTLSESITDGQTLFGVETEVALGARLTFGADAEWFRLDTGDTRNEAELRLAYAISDRLTIEGGVQFTDKNTLLDPTETGQRTDVGLRLRFATSDVAEYYVFGQTTVAKQGGLSDNNRYGAGFDVQVSDRLGLSGEASTGNAGFGGALRLTYAATDQNEIYLGYTLDPTRSGAGGALADDGKVVLGGRYAMTESLSLYTESVLDMPSSQRSLSRIFGVNYTPSDAWVLSSTVERGSVQDPVSGDFERLALSLGAAYDNGDERSWRARLEYRDESGTGTARDRLTWGLSAGYSNKTNENWRFLANVDALFSESIEGSFRNGEYVKASAGYAFRPVDNEKLNLLLRYTYLRDLPGEDQVSADGSVDGPLQFSNVFSLNAGYDLSPSLTIGGKLGYRMASTAPRGTTVFTSNTAVLAVARLEWHVVNNWDITGEGRLLHTVESGTLESGATAAIYRQLGERVKLGAGVEWGSVSDDLTNINYSSRGAFLNLIAKF
ncbi:MAG: hypothetical protein L3J37_10865 [Rhodobacteraceae bacterium]|nr:hypothetical protein [Paracoccaceae bacterium]